VAILKPRMPALDPDHYRTRIAVVLPAIKLDDSCPAQGDYNHTERIIAVYEPSLKYYH